MEDRVRKAIRKVLKEFLDTSKSKVDMSKVTDAEIAAFEKAMTYAAGFVNEREEKIVAEVKTKDTQPKSLSDLFFNEEDELI